MILCAIAAMARNRVIGKLGQLPWHISEDLKFFKQKTSGRTIIMGRKTFDSLGRPLPHRRNIVLSRDQTWMQEGVEVFSSLDQALETIERQAFKTEEVFVVGGAEIYKQSLNRLNRIYLTLIEQEIEGDTYFPDVLKEASFKITSDVPGVESNSSGISYRFLILDRKN
ncbi:MAG: hypothetical protein COV44_07810 [Deltaproteobacteria bacterium CG11_big_fil_rev_8_21_14_0_20_45_16]|nr:MAG: hypothetical protein COV44_07810 [Deltaproteobacteria bacterium CG11_big_fil_rev_8_21_14_0_20_45_16]